MTFANGPGDVGVQNFAVDPREEFIASIDMNGVLTLHSVDLGGAKETRELPNDIDIEVAHKEQVAGRDDDRGLQKAGLSWHPDGSVLAVPGRTTVVLLKRPAAHKVAWESEQLVASKDTTHSANVSVLSWSDDGALLASADTDGMTVVWNMWTKEPFALINNDAPVTSLQWAGENLMVSDADGAIGSFFIKRPSRNAVAEETKVVEASVKGGGVEELQSEHQVTVDDTQPVADSDDEVVPAKWRVGKKLRADGVSAPAARTAASSDSDEELDFDSEEEASKINIKKKSPVKKGPKMIDDEAVEEKEVGHADAREQDDKDHDDDDDTADKEEEDESMKVGMDELNSSDDDMINEEADNLEMGEDADDTEGASTVPAVPATMSLSPPQAAFMPSSTPLEDDRRILCWNAVGCIASREEGFSNAIEIDFADTTAHRAIKFQDRNDLNLGALGEEAAIFANVPDDDNNEERIELEKQGASELVLQKLKTDQLTKRKPSMIYCNIFNAATSAAGTWTRHLGQGEKAEVLAIGTDWVVVFTDQQLARIFSIGGVELEVFRIPGSIITAAGTGRRLFYAYRNGTSSFGPSVGYQLLDVPGRKQINSGVLPLVQPSPGAGVKLQWVGFAEPHGMPCFLDSTGVLSGLTTSFGGTWAPILDSKVASQNTSDHFWPIAVMDARLTAVTLKGSARTYPTVFPRPLATSTPLAVPASQPDKNFEPHESLALTNSVLRRAAPPSMSAAAILSSDFNDDVANVQALALDKALLKLMKVACDVERYEAALDAAKQLTLEGSFKIALLLAGHCNLPSLYPRIQAVMEERKDEEERSRMAVTGSNDDNEEAEEVYDPKQPWDRKETKLHVRSSMMGRSSFGDEGGAETAMMVSPWSVGKPDTMRPSVSAVHCEIMPSLTPK